MFVLVTTFLMGMGLGLAVAVPVGPMALLCIHRALAGGFKAGAAAGFGIALADGMYAGVAAFGLTALTLVLLDVQIPLRAAGVLAMGWLAFSIWRKAGRIEAAVPKTAPTLKSAGETFVLTLTNPTTIFSFLALFVGSGIGLLLTLAESTALVVGTFAGSMAWWLILSGAVSILRVRMNATAILWINRSAALALGAFALGLGISLIRHVWK